ncbi:MAG: hydrogenase formation protein HypD [Deltaproteobacteria bacterium]|nr:MAG: hydrogenase formation protein HypD [Deltaproteobacteria bacterium]
MRLIDGFRQPRAAAALTAELAELGTALGARQVKLMEVCGSHTMAIARHGLKDLLPPNVRLVSGPGCPVCVTDPGYVDAALAIAERGAAVATFGDMLRVPGSRGSLADARADGADVRVFYSPVQVLDWAAADRGRPWVVLAVGFETTAAPLAALALEIRRRGCDNVTLLTATKTVPPALDALVTDPALSIDGFLCPAHVSAIIGARAYLPYAEEHGRACVVAGFEPLDVLDGVRALLTQLLRGEPRVDNRYERVVRWDGNPAAQRAIARVFRTVDAPWRGLGVIPGSGLALADDLSDLDASLRFELPVTPGRVNPACRCGDVLKGVIDPEGCRLFGAPCTPDRPFGPCMVSSEGSCAAAWRYRRSTQ